MLVGEGAGLAALDCRQSRVRAEMAGVCTSLMAEWKHLTQCERGWRMPARGTEGCALLAAVRGGEV